VGFGIRATVDQGAPAWVRIYDVTGRRVRSLKLGPLNRGQTPQYWDGNDDQGGAVAGGIYFLRLEIAGRSYGSVKATVLR
jgi:flagellar hook assembly protein FlgD